ncbi:uncharacterized protein LOC143319871 [Chaetodon auriga]|uniref:uncharacterized protein LOC143319871 n=1 Tax=Chaetodon auriga TaxID=39042 RepID=UPI004032BCF0
MRTGAILILILFISTLLIPAYSANNQTNHSQITTLAPEDESGPATAWTQSPMTETKKGTVENVTTQNDTTPESTTAALPSSTHPSKRPDQFSPTVVTKNTTVSTTSSSKFMLFVILLAIVVLMLFAGCLHAMRDRDSSQDSSVSRFLVGVRKRLRDAIGYLEDRLGLCLWPVGMTGGEDDEEEEEGEGKLEEEGGQRRDNRGEGGSRGVKNDEKVEQKEEDSSDSSDNSSIEGDNLREMALSRQEEEEKKQIENEDGDETSSESEGDLSAVEGQSSGDKKGGSEEIALVNPLQENDQRADLCDVTVL